MSAGLGPFGLGTPADSTERPTGKAGSRFLNPQTRDYEIDPAGGQYKQMPGTRQRVLIAVTTALNSSGQRGLGIKPPGRMSETFEAEQRAAVAEALRPMTEVEKSVRLDGVIVERGSGGRARTTIIFKDLVNGNTDSVRI